MNEKNRVTVKLEWSCEAYTAELVPLKRKSIYGDRKVIAIDKEDKECRSRSWKYKEKDSPLGPPKGVWPCPHLDFSAVNWILDYYLQKV